MPKVKAPSSVIRRSAPKTVERMLYVSAGGRCEFRGCNDYLLRHPLTKEGGNFSSIAHICAFSPDGPRGRVQDRPVDPHSISNLILLCPKCHKLIDDRPDTYTVDLLKEHKRIHEERIHRVTGLGPEMETAVIRMTAMIGKDISTISQPRIMEAIRPKYPAADLVPIDISQITEGAGAYYEVAINEVRRKIDRVYESGGIAEKTKHLSLFALGPIPLLVYLGSRMSNKVELDLYQRHRDTDGWAWKEEGEPIDYLFGCLRLGTDRDKVALLLSLSGTIKIDELPESIGEEFHVYGITLKGMTPTPHFLNLRKDLERFRIAYREGLREIQCLHGNLSELHLFPAVPAPLAVVCGRDILPKTDPDLIVYDHDKARGGYTPALRIERTAQ